jgi:Flp pilus assembly protein TadB
MAINVVLALVAAFGVLVIVLALISPRTVKLKGRDDYVQQEYGPLERLEQKIEQAGLDVTSGEVIRLSAFLAVMLGVLGFLLTNATVGAVVGAVIGAYAYWAYLADRRDRRRLEYQAALGDVAALLIEGFKEGGTVQAALNKVVEFGPEITREDFAGVAARLQGGKSLAEALQPLQELRRDPILDAIAQMLVVRVERGGQASEALGGLLDVVRERIQFRQRVQAELGQPVWEVRLIAALPFLVVAFLRATTPEYARFWRTALGQLSLGLSWGMVAVGYWMANRYITKAMAVEENLGVVETPSKAAERSAGLPVEEG